MTRWMCITAIERKFHGASDYHSFSRGDSRDTGGRLGDCGDRRSSDGRSKSANSDGRLNASNGLPIYPDPTA